MNDKQHLKSEDDISPFDSDYILHDAIKTKTLRAIVKELEIGDYRKIDYEFEPEGLHLSLGNIRSKLCRIAKEENIRLRTKAKNYFLWVQRIG